MPWAPLIRTGVVDLWAVGRASPRYNRRTPSPSTKTAPRRRRSQRLDSSKSNLIVLSPIRPHISASFLPYKPADAQPCLFLLETLRSWSFTWPGNNALISVLGARSPSPSHGQRAPRAGLRRAMTNNLDISHRYREKKLPTNSAPPFPVLFAEAVCPSASTESSG